MRWIVFLAAFGFCSLFSCDDNDRDYQTIVRGRVINGGTGNPIPNVSLSLKDWLGEYPGEKNIVEANSDENGFFELILNGGANTYLGAHKEGYYCFQVLDRRSSCDELIPFRSGTYEDITVKLVAKAWFNGIFMSPEAQPSDMTNIRLWGRTSDPKKGKGPFCFYSGCNTDISVRGDYYLLIHFQYTRNGEWLEKTDSVYIKSFEVYRDTIYY